MGGPAVQTPAWQVSLTVHASESAHATPSGWGGFEQTPLIELHVPVRWQASEATHVTEEPAMQERFWHVSPIVQASPSSQAAPFGDRLSGGQEEVNPVQCSNGSHGPVDGRQILVTGSFCAPGQARPTPSHVLAFSHAPGVNPGAQSVPLGTIVQTPSAEAPSAAAHAWQSSGPP